MAEKVTAKEEGEKPSIPLKKTEAEAPIKAEVIRKAEKQITLEHPTVRSGGKTTVGVYVNNGKFDEEKSVEQKNGVITIPNNPDQYALRDALVKSGFIDKTDYGLTRPTPTLIPVKPRPVKWYFQHPEHTKEHPIDSVIGVYANGDEVGVEFQNGQAVITDEGVANALENAGFWITKTDVK